jgi:ubiquinone/menaquinone biosynthesis C-methylase UbiE
MRVTAARWLVLAKSMQSRGRTVSLMERRERSIGLAEVAALARIDEMGAHMTTGQAAGAESADELERRPKTQDRAMWALGDYHTFARQTVWELGPILVDVCGISRGQRVLDVAAGTGNVAIRAAEAGATVVASDLTPENFESGRREAREHGVELEWMEADAEALPFDDGEFDVVTSSLGAIFAPDHQRVADELLRVCRPGGTIGLLAFTPEGLAAPFFECFARYTPPPPAGAQPPILWGSENHVRELFGDRVQSLELTRREYVERAASPQAYVELFQATFGPLVALRAFLADQPDKAAGLDGDFLEFATRENRGSPGGPAEYPYEYLVVVARKKSS